MIPPCRDDPAADPKLHRVENGWSGDRFAGMDMGV